MSVVMTEEERAQVLREFEAFIKENRPERVEVKWKGVFETIEHSTSGPGYMKVHFIVVGAEAGNKRFSVTYGSSALSSDSPKDFGEILERNGYRRAYRYGATGYWTYVYVRGDEEEKEPDEEEGYDEDDGGEG